MLRHHTERADAKVGEMLDGGKGKDHPLATLNHLGHLLSEKVRILQGRLVGTATDGGQLALRGPWGREHLGGSAVPGEIGQKPGRWMGQMLNGKGDVTGGAETAYRVAKTQ